MTHSGVLVTLQNGAAPTLQDLALGISRQPRFGGQTRRWWSVLDHTMFATELAAEDRATPRLMLAIMLHDAHEGLTGDIPTLLKPDQMRAVQATLDVRIMEAYFPGGWHAYDTLCKSVKKYDRRALMAEARLVGPPGLDRSVMNAAAFADLFGGNALLKDAVLLQELLNEHLCGREDLLPWGAHAANVIQFVEICERLRQEILN